MRVAACALDEIDRTRRATKNRRKPSPETEPHRRCGIARRARLRRYSFAPPDCSDCPSSVGPLPPVVSSESPLSPKSQSQKLWLLDALRGAPWSSAGLPGDDSSSPIGAWSGPEAKIPVSAGACGSDLSSGVEGRSFSADVITACQIVAG